MSRLPNKLRDAISRLVRVCIGSERDVNEAEFLARIEVEGLIEEAIDDARPWRQRMPLLEEYRDMKGENPMTFDERLPDNAYLRGQARVHERFGLSYASYLVVPRLVLQSMPLAWQEDFCDLMSDLHEELGDEWEPENGYSVRAKGANGKYRSDPWNDYRRGKMLRPKCYDAKEATE